MESKTRTLILLGNITPFVSALKRMVLPVWEKISIVDEDGLEAKLSGLDPTNTVAVLDTLYNSTAQVNKWVWSKLRLNEERIGKQLAGIPFLVLGKNKQFLKSPEGKVFRDYKYFHQYLTKPLNLKKFIETLSILSPVDPGSLPVVNQDAPKSLLGALEHDLKDISKKFNYNRNYKELKKRFHDIIIDLSNFELLEKDEKKVSKAKGEVEKLKNEMVKRMGNKWE